MEWFDLSYKEYKLAKSNIFKKLNIKRSSELFKNAIKLKLLKKIANKITLLPQIANIEHKIKICK